jgi:hypothetical protein
MKLIHTEIYQSGKTGYCFDCIEETHANSRLRYIHVFQDANGRSFTGWNTSFFDHTAKSKQRQKLIKQINTILDNLPNNI